MEWSLNRDSATRYLYTQPTMNCPLCATRATLLEHVVLKRRFYCCPQCALAFHDPGQRLSPEEEKSRYAQHNNDSKDPRYRNFLRPLYEEICASVPPGKSGLDFGAGSSPALAEMLEENGYQVRCYDPIYYPEKSPLQLQYDFVVTSEVVEHFSEPAQEFKRLRHLLKPGAPLAVMTLMYNESTDFSSWYYLRDPTHICAYSQKTFEFIAQAHRFKSVSFKSERVIVLTAG